MRRPYFDRTAQFIKNKRTNNNNKIHLYQLFKIKNMLNLHKFTTRIKLRNRNRKHSSSSVVMIR